MEISESFSLKFSKMGILEEMEFFVELKVGSHYGLSILG